MIWTWFRLGLAADNTYYVALNKIKLMENKTVSVKDYRIIVSALGGTPYITKISKDNRRMLSDRREIPDNEVFHFIEQFVRNRLNEGDNILEVTDAKGNKIFSITIGDQPQ